MKDTDKLIEGCAALVIGMTAAAIGSATLGAVAGPVGLLIAGGASIRAQLTSRCRDRPGKRVMAALTSDSELAPHIPEAAAIVGTLRNDLFRQIDTTSLVSLTWHKIPEEIAKPVLGSLDSTTSEGARRVVGLVLTETARVLTEDDEFRTALRDDRSLTTLREVVAVNQHVLVLLSELRELRSAVFDRAVEAGVPAAVVIRLARRISADVDDPYSAMEELARAVEIAERVEREGHTPSNHADFVDEVMARVAALARESRYADAGNEIDAALARDEEETRARRTKLFDRGIEVATLDRDPARVADLLVKKGDLEAGGRMSLESMNQKMREWGVDDHADKTRLELSVCVELGRVWKERASDVQEKVSALYSFGFASHILGGRLLDRFILKQAASAFREALDAGKSSLSTHDITVLRFQLAQTLAVMGEREGGDENFTEALSIFKSVQEEWCLDVLPIRWSEVEGSIAGVLFNMGTREEGTYLLRKSEVSFRKALAVLTHDKHPDVWCDFQMNLGNALSVIGIRENLSNYLVRAVEAYEATLRVRTRERVPGDWAILKTNMGASLTELGYRQLGLARQRTLYRAVSELKDALTVNTLENIPMEHARSSMNLGLAFAAIAAREPGVKSLEDAMAAYRDALKVWRPENSPLDWANAFGLEAFALHGMARRKNDADLAASALKQLQKSVDFLLRFGNEYLGAKFASSIPTFQRLVTELQQVS